MSTLIEDTKQFVSKTLKNAEGGHDYLHTMHVLRLAETIAKKEGGTVDHEVIACGALLHDIADSKFHQGDENIGPDTAYEFLKKVGADEQFCKHVENIVRHISFKGSLEGQKWMSPELAIVQDADRLAGMGAVGIARTFNYGGSKGRKIYDPEIPAKEQQTKDEYKTSEAPTINHFYEKLLLLKELMNTKTGKKMAEIRHVRMEQFLDAFYEEWEGVN